ncbi:hypothetical protein SAMN04488559_12819 [Isobaculum melis]|uniref:Uncharacterized protein n=1 Tax=Isobaculum melis TaxID=142588 RepID=A0A1H9UEX4_9LACT|nr:hypothetical protein SAMN04488559_12819 [Isobaculum melis]
MSGFIQVIKLLIFDILDTFKFLSVPKKAVTVYSKGVEKIVKGGSIYEKNNQSARRSCK